MKCVALACLTLAVRGNHLKTARPSPWAIAADVSTQLEVKDQPPISNATDCSPKCLWKCLGTASCQEVCEPMCAPPKCQTSCRPVNPGKCTQKCEPPRCAVICPEKHCEGNTKCGQCKTVCGEPVCRVECQQDCQTNCADPKCDWKCQPTTQCPEPKCELRCGTPQGCLAATDLSGQSGKLQVPVGAQVVSRGLASLDPKEFETEAALAPAPAAAPVLSPATA
ncbi:unnamed protein product [Effrenium voratum]|uniref:Uncharacterized protein n=2 Tax=Effrenium voratum TaxID=2562239 RepID=A0AA36MNB5_9DINO|nr:unnamed protein product [Effrenium voratum]